MSFFESIDPVFMTYAIGNAPVKQLATGFAIILKRQDVQSP